MLHHDYNQRNLLITHTTYVSGTGWVLQAEYVYDGANDRLQQVDHTGASPVTTTYTNDAFGLTQVLVADDVMDQVYNLFGLDLIQQDDDSTVRTLLADGLGSVRVETAGGSVTAVTTYSPYGEVLDQSGASGTVYGFTGEQEDSATGLLYLRARYFNAYIYRMLTPDTIVPDLNNPQSLNLYTYVENNPVLYTDPSGHCIDGITTVPCVVIAGGVVVVIGSTVVVHHATQQLLDTPFVQQGIEDLANAVGGFFDNLGEDVAEAIEDCRVVLFRGGPEPQTQAARPSPRLEPYQPPLPFPDPHPLSEPEITPVPLPPPSPDDDSNDRLYHYGTRSKIDYIVTYQVIPFSDFNENPKRARFGSGIYFTDLAPGSRTKAQLASTFYRLPFASAQKSVEAWVYVDVSGLDVFPTGRPHVFVHLRESDLPVSGRIIANGQTP